VCNPDGTCRKCALHSECATATLTAAGFPTGVCDPSNGQCASSTNIAFVHLRDTGGSTCTEPNPLSSGGTSSNPYCQVTTVLTNNTLNGRQFVLVASSSLSGTPLYTALNLTDTVNAYLVGPGRNASTVFGVDTFNHCVEIAAASTKTINLTFDGFHFSGNSSGSTLYCDNAGVSTTLTVRNSLISAGDNGIHAFACTLNVSETLIQGATGTGNGDGLLLDDGSNYTVQNVIISGSSNAGVETTSLSNGTFSFNTLSFNGTSGVGGVICGHNPTRIDDSIISGNTQVSGSQFSGTCALNNVVTGTDALAVGPSPSPTFVSTTPPYNLRLLVDDAPSGPHTTQNRSCCIDRISTTAPSPTPLPTIDIDHSARPKSPSSPLLDVGAHEAL
jgi:hypothetical protein